jgi:hypothetical protein
MFSLRKLIAVSAAALVIGVSAVASPFSTQSASADCNPMFQKCITLNQNLTIKEELKKTPVIQKIRFPWVPTATILYPASPDEYEARQAGGFSFAATVWLVGHGYDQEDGTLSGSSLVWTTSMNGGPEQFLGTGKEIWAQLYTDGISPYTNHVVKLTVTDSDGNSHSDTVNVTVHLDGTIVFYDDCDFAKKVVSMLVVRQAHHERTSPQTRSSCPTPKME